MRARCGPEATNRARLFCNEQCSSTCKSRQTSRFAIISTGRYSFSAVNSNLNLASKPFSNRLLPWALTAIILFVSVIGLVLVVRLTTTTVAGAKRVEAENAQLKQQEQIYLNAAKQVENSFSPDQQQELPAATQLVDRKGFSWSRLLVDLESSLPDKVKVS